MANVLEEITAGSHMGEVLGADHAATTTMTTGIVVIIVAKTDLGIITVEMIDLEMTGEATGSVVEVEIDLEAEEAVELRLEGFIV